ncbi:MAG: divalent-cation tolerance protein CutA [Mariprofundaceae bacterium]|nr:divalent-cation tolerance protein CutA [Mariprofundaceae bacterium]
MLITSVDSQPVAESLARNIVRQRLAACVQVSASVTSAYHWEDHMESAEEYSLSIKTTVEKLDETIAWLHQHHPYEVPELIWWPVHASDGYAGWVNESVQSVRSLNRDEGDDH